jgi:transketolase
MSQAFYARDAYGKTLVELGKKDSNVIVLDADLSGSTRTAFFGEHFPERFFNMGVAEQNMIATAAGFACVGKIVFASTFCMFGTMRVLDQIRNTVAYNNLNVKIVVSHAGLTVGPDGASHQALEDLAVMRAIPKMRVIVPSDAEETIQAVITAYKEKGPFYIRFGRAKAPVIENKKKFTLGQGYILNEGKDVAVIAVGIMVSKALKAAERLKDEGINPYVVNIPTIKPIDQELILELSSKVKGFVVCEEHSIIGGVASAVAEVLSENKPNIVKRVGVRDRFGQSGDPDELLEEYGLTISRIAEAVKEII